MAMRLEHGAQHADAELITAGAAAHADIGIDKKYLHGVSICAICG